MSQFIRHAEVINQVERSHFYNCKQRNRCRFNKPVVDHLTADKNGDNQAGRGLPSSQEDVWEPVNSSANADDNPAAPLHGCNQRRHMFPAHYLRKRPAGGGEAQTRAEGKKTNRAGLKRAKRRRKNKRVVEENFKKKSRSLLVFMKMEGKYSIEAPGGALSWSIFHSLPFILQRVQAENGISWAKNKERGDGIVFWAKLSISLQTGERR